MPVGLYCAICGQSRVAPCHWGTDLPQSHAFEAIPQVATGDGFNQMETLSLMATWRPGSCPEPWDWDDEIRDLTTRDEDHMRAFTAEVAKAGAVLVPVKLGHDGRVWDGHHRIVVASMLSLPSIPFEFVASPEEAPEGPETGGEDEADEMRPGRPGFWHNVVGHPLLVLCPPLGEWVHRHTSEWVYPRKGGEHAGR
jgi:hypothetical protein